MKTIWKNIEVWLKDKAPHILSSLQKGATLAEIGRAEKALSAEFTSDIKASYRIHNGQSDISAPLIEEWQLLTLKEVIRRWSMLKQLYDEGVFADVQGMPTGPIRAEWWNPNWIPIAHNGDGDLRCLDLSPAQGGKVGQIISFWHTEERREKVADSYQTWLAEFAQNLHDGQYRVQDGYIIRVDK